ncbi:MAG: UPF0175 family protein [Thermoplasmata archaeon]|nr:UPF0175 family protein [Thermoplasmata archaeon]
MSINVSKTTEMKLKALISAGIYSNEKEIIEDAIKGLFEDRKELNVQAALKLYTSGEISLAKASAIAGMNIIEFKDYLQRIGITRVIAVEKAGEMDKKIKKLLGEKNENIV